MREISNYSAVVPGPFIVLMRIILPINMQPFLSYDLNSWYIQINRIALRSLALRFLRP
jgi:hypothetical protein